MAKIGNEWFEDHDIIVEDCTVPIDIAIIAVPSTPMFIRLFMLEGCYRKPRPEVFPPISLDDYDDDNGDDDFKGW